MRRGRIVCFALAACSAPAKPSTIEGEEVGELKQTRSNDCPNIKLGPWTSEAFPACAPMPLPTLPICDGPCARPCSSNTSGYEGPMGQFSVDRTRTFAYDAQGRFLSSTIDGEPETTCTYESGRLASCTIYGNTQSVTRDANGRITAFVGSGSEPEAVTYDGKGRVIAVGNTTLSYDRSGWLADVGGKPFEHDADGRVIKEGAGDRAITYEYEGDRLVRVNGPGQNKRPAFQYDAQGRFSAMRTGGLEESISTVYRYDCSPK